jgi:hypothetical protein
MTDQIHDMRSYFTGPHGMSSAIFAQGILAAQKAALRRQIETIGFAPASQVKILDVTLQEPTAIAGIPVVAYVNAGRWLAKCECGGAEFVDFEDPSFMCCSCWNEPIGHAWRTVVIPAPATRVAVDRLLILRPEENRNWKGESVATLADENRARDLGMS